MSAVPNMAVVCSSLTSCFPGVLLRYCLSNFEMISVAYYYYYYYSHHHHHHHDKTHLFPCIALTGWLR
jgi:hypothetical protein